MYVAVPRCHDYSKCSRCSLFWNCIATTALDLGERDGFSHQRAQLHAWRTQLWQPADKHRRSNTYKKRLSGTVFKGGGGLRWTFIICLNLQCWFVWEGKFIVLFVVKSFACSFFLNTFAFWKIGFVRYTCRLVCATWVIWNMATEVNVLGIELHHFCFC